MEGKKHKQQGTLDIRNDKMKRAQGKENKNKKQTKIYRGSPGKETSVTKMALGTFDAGKKFRWFVPEPDCGKRGAQEVDQVLTKAKERLWWSIGGPATAEVEL